MNLGSKTVETVVGWRGYSQILPHHSSLFSILSTLDHALLSGPHNGLQRGILATCYSGVFTVYTSVLLCAVSGLAFATLTSHAVWNYLIPLQRGFHLNTSYMHRLASGIIIVLALAGCTTVTVTRPSVEAAALADITTTALVIQAGGHELNPLGFLGTTALKGLYIAVVRPELDSSTQSRSDRWASSIWTAAAANNLVQLVLPGSVVSYALFGSLVFLLYKD